MNTHELNTKLRNRGLQEVNTSRELDPLGPSLWQCDGAWVIVSDDDRGKPTYWKMAQTAEVPPGASVGQGGMLRFSSEDSACEYLWQTLTAPPPPIGRRTLTRDEIIAKGREQTARYAKSVEDRRKRGS